MVTRIVRPFRATYSGAVIPRALPVGYGGMPPWGGGHHPGIRKPEKRRARANRRPLGLRFPPLRKPRPRVPRRKSRNLGAETLRRKAQDPPRHRCGNLQPICWGNNFQLRLAPEKRSFPPYLGRYFQRVGAMSVSTDLKIPSDTLDLNIALP